MINLHESIGPGSNSRSLYQQSNSLPIACFGEQGKMAFISGEQRKKGQILRGTETILWNREYKKTKFEGTEEQANLFQRNKETGTPPPHEMASHIT